MQADLEYKNSQKIRTEQDKALKLYREVNDNLLNNRKHREQVMKEIDRSQDIVGISEPQNVNLLPFKDINRATQRRQFEKEIYNLNCSLEQKKKQQQQHDKLRKQEEREIQEKFTTMAKTIEDQEKERKKAQFQSVQEYWKNQEAKKKSIKQWEKEANDQDGQKYIQYVNEFTDRYTITSLLIRFSFP